MGQKIKIKRGFQPLSCYTDIHSKIKSEASKQGKSIKDFVELMWKHYGKSN